MPKPLLLAPISFAALALFASGASAAAITNIRISPHPDHVRVVVDLDAEVTYKIADDGSLTLEGLEGENAVLNASASEAPLKRVVLAPMTGGARLAFETAAPTTTRASLLKPDKSGGNRLVVDLYPKDPPPKPAPAPGPAAALDIPPTNKGPAVGTTAALPPAATETPDPVTPVPSEAAVPSMPVDATVEMPETPASFGPPGLPAPATLAPAPIAATSGPGYTDEVLRAERSLDRGDAKDACARADGLVKSNPRDLRALVVLGGCKLALGDAMGAKGAYLTALDADPSFDRARVGLATADDMMGDHTAARIELSKVLGHNVPAEDLAKLLAALNELPAPSAGKPIEAVK